MNKVRKTVLAYVADLKNAAKSLPPQASDDEKAALRRATKLLADSVKSLIRIIDQHDALLAVSATCPPRRQRDLAASFAVVPLSSAGMCICPACSSPHRRSETSRSTTR